MMNSYVKRTSKRLRKEILDKALEEVLEELRKICFPWKRRKFILDDIEIIERNFYKEEGNENTLGLYEWDEEQLKHKIYIAKHYIWGCHRLEDSWLRKYHYKKLKSVIHHEVCHAYLQERFEYKCNRYITGKGRDASPLFLSILYFTGGYTSHDCLKGFENTELWNKIFEFGTYEELEDYLLDMLWNYTVAIDQIQEINNKDDFIKGAGYYYSITNKFEFAPRINGLEKISELNWESIYKQNSNIKRSKTINRTWQIGCNVTPDMLLNLYNKKQDCAAKYYDNTKQLVIVPNCTKEELKTLQSNDLKVITVRENKNFAS